MCIDKEREIIEAVAGFGGLVGTGPLELVAPDLAALKAPLVILPCPPVDDADNHRRLKGNFGYGTEMIDDS